MLFVFKWITGSSHAPPTP